MFLAFAKTRGHYHPHLWETVRDIFHYFIINVIEEENVLHIYSCANVHKLELCDFCDSLFLCFLNSETKKGRNCIFELCETAPRVFFNPANRVLFETFLKVLHNKTASAFQIKHPLDSKAAVWWLEGSSLWLGALQGDAFLPAFEKLSIGVKHMFQRFSTQKSPPSFVSSKKHEHKFCPAPYSLKDPNNHLVGKSDWRQSAAWVPN